MNQHVIIVGTAPIALNIAKTLCEEPNISLSIIESEEKRYLEMKDLLDADFIHGCAADPKILKRAQVQEATLFLALQRDLSVNIAAAMIVRYFNPKTKIISSIDSISFKSYGKKLQEENSFIDQFVCPEILAAETTLQLIKHPYIVEYNPILNGKFVIIGVNIDDEISIVDKPLFKIKQEMIQLSMLVVGISRQKEFIIPRGDTTVISGDILHFLVAKKHVKPLFEKLGIKKTELKKIVIGGGGKFASTFLERIKNKPYEITVLEENPKIIEPMRQQFPKVSFIEADIRHLDLLIDQRIFEADAYIAMTDNEHVNFVSASYAKQISNLKTVTLAFERDNVMLFKNHGIEYVVNPKILIIDKVLGLLHTDNLLSVVTLWNEQGEMVELQPKKGSPLLNKKLKELSILPKGMLIGVVEHKGYAQIADGNTVITEQDRVIFFSKHGMLGHALKLLA